MSLSIVGICCSPRQGQSTFKAMNVCLDAAKKADPQIETQLIELADKKIGPCTACGICKQGLICGWEDDFAELIPVLADPTVAGINLALLMRATFGIGKPRSLQEGLQRLSQRLFGRIRAVRRLVMAACDLWRRKHPARPKSSCSKLRIAAA